MKSIKDLIKTADAYGTETRALQEKRDAEMQEGWFGDAVAAVKNALGSTSDEAEKIVDKKQADAGEEKSGKVAKPGSMGGTTPPVGGGADAATTGVDGPADATAAATQADATTGVDGPADAAAA